MPAENTTDDAQAPLRSVEPRPAIEPNGFVKGYIQSWRERHTARQLSQELLRMCLQLQHDAPGTSGVALYHALVRRHTGMSSDEVTALLDRVHESFAIWPVERPLRLRDVVQYLAATALLDASPNRLGISTHLATIVAEEIPAEI